MLKYWDWNIAFQEIPDEVSLAVNLTLCSQHCVGCHSPHLWGDVGKELTLNFVFGLIDKYYGEITCFALFGGDNDNFMVYSILDEIKSRYKGNIKTAWYSGRNELPKSEFLHAYDYIKVGGYDYKLGGLDHRTTNQRMYKVVDGKLEDITRRFWKK